MTYVNDVQGVGELPAVLTVRDLAQLLRLGTNTVYRLLRQGKIKNVRMGRQYRIPRWAVLEYIGQTGIECA